MKEVWTIAGNACKNILKLKVVYFLVACVLILVGSMYRYNEISLNRHRELLLDMSLLLNQVAAILTVLSLTFDIPRELREGIAATFLTKSLGRMKYLWGKVLGIYAVACVVCTLIAVGSYIIYASCFPEPVFQVYLKIQILILLSAIPMTAICTFCAVTFPEMAAPIIGLMAIWFSSLTHRLKVPVLSGGILPDLDIFNMKEHVIYQADLPWSYIFGAALYGIVFAVFLMMLSGIIFRLKDIK